MSELENKLDALDKVIFSGVKQAGDGGKQTTFDDLKGLLDRRSLLKSMIEGERSPTIFAKFTRD